MLDQKYKISIELIDDEASEETTINEAMKALRDCIIEALSNYNFDVHDVTVEHIKE
jgi:hypothetical protein